MENAYLPNYWGKDVTGSGIIYSFFDDCDQLKLSLAVSDMAVTCGYYGWLECQSLSLRLARSTPNRKCHSTRLSSSQGRSFCAVRANAENSCAGAFVRTFARTLPKCSLVGILCCVRDLFSANAECSCSRAFVKPFARTLPNRTRTFCRSIFSASFGSDRRSCEHKYFTFRFVGMLLLLLLSVTS